MRTIGLLLILPLLVGATAAPSDLAPSIAAARGEAIAAEARLQRLGAAAAAAGDDAARLHAEQDAAAAAIEASEARIAEAGAGLSQARAGLAAADAALARQRAPQAALIAGIATMARRPPLLALFSDRGGIAEMVRVRALLAATSPVIAARTSALTGQLRQRQALVDEAARLEAALTRRRAELDQHRAHFALLEASARTRVASLSGAALGVGDRLLASGESLAALGNAAAAEAAARRAAGLIAATPFAPPRPVRAEDNVPPPLAYRLPVVAPLDQGLGAIDANFIVSRGNRFLTPRGASVVAPASGKIMFADAYRGHDGVVIIDHGGGWTSVLIDVSPSVVRGAKVAPGEVIGRALGPVTVELRHRGTPVSPSLISGSSGGLSNGGKSG